MTALDQKTLIVVVSSITLLMGVLMLHFTRKNSNLKGPEYWSIGSFLIAFGALFFIFSPLEESFIVMVFASTMIVAGISLYYAGIQAFNEVKLYYWIIIGIPIFEFAQALLFFTVWYIPFVRMTIYSIINTVLAVLIIREFLRPVSPIMRLSYILGIIVFGIFGLTSLSRAIFSGFYQPGNSIDLGIINIILFFFHSITQTLLLFVFLLMLSTRLTEKLNKKIEDQQKFFSIIAHDLRGPIGAQSQMLSLCNQPGLIEDNELRPIIRELEKMSFSTYNLLQDLLLWSRNELEGLTANIQVFDIDKVITRNVELLSQFSNTKGVNIEYIKAENYLCKADEKMIETVIRNLISNSIKFTNHGGNIKISSWKSGNEIKISVADNGVGMSEDALSNFRNEKLLISKSNNKTDIGTGLGLKLCVEFIRKNNGTIQINSAINIGTEVIISLETALG